MREMNDGRGNNEIMDLNVTKEDYMNDQHAFELALHRVRTQALREGRKSTFGELLKLATSELEQEYERNKALAASLPDHA
jgi:hypothetical protein